MNVSKLDKPTLVTLALAAHLADLPDRQVKLLARRYARATISPNVRKAYRAIIESASPSQVVLHAYKQLSEIKNGTQKE